MFEVGMVATLNPKTKINACLIYCATNCNFCLKFQEYFKLLANQHDFEMH